MTKDVNFRARKSINSFVRYRKYCL